VERGVGRRSGIGQPALRSYRRFAHSVLECGEFSPLCDSSRLVGCAARSAMRRHWWRCATKVACTIRHPMQKLPALRATTVARELAPQKAARTRRTPKYASAPVTLRFVPRAGWGLGTERSDIRQPARRTPQRASPEGKFLFVVNKQYSLRSFTWRRRQVRQGHSRAAVSPPAQVAACMDTYCARCGLRQLQVACWPDCPLVTCPKSCQQPQHYPAFFEII
jgi:hypothetical protein